MRFKDWIAFLLLGFIWGSSFLWIKLALREISPLTLVSFRLLFGIIGLGILLLISKPKLPNSFRIYAILFLIGIIGNALPYVLITWGEQYIDSSVAAILNSTTPLFTMIIAHLFLSDDKMNLKRVISLVIGFIGVIILVLRDLDFNHISSSMVIFTVLGELAVLLASLCYSTSSVFARGTTKGLSPSVVAFFPLLGADLIMWTITPIFNHQTVFPSLPLTWIALLWLGFIGIGIAIKLDKESQLGVILLFAVIGAAVSAVLNLFEIWVPFLIGLIFAAFIVSKIFSNK